MGILSHLIDLVKNYIVGKHPVKALYHAIREVALKIQMSYIMTGMYTTVGPATPGNLHRFLQHQCNGIFQYFLNRYPIRLALPANISMSVV